MAVVVVLSVIGLSGCGIAHIRTLREAQDSFSRAAEIDNSNRLSDHESPGEIAEAISGYGVAAGLTKELLAKKEKELRQDNLLCTTYMLRAMSLWRLGRYGEASGVAKAGEGCEAGQDVPRERALLKSIPALIRIDESNTRVINDMASQAEYETTKSEIELALQTLEQAGGANPGSPVNGYLLTARLAAVRVWQVAITREGLGGEQRLAAITATSTKAKTTWQEYRVFLECQLLRKNDSSVEKWRVLLSLPSAAATEVNCSAGGGSGH